MVHGEVWGFSSRFSIVLIEIFLGFSGSFSLGSSDIGLTLEKIHFRFRNPVPSWEWEVKAFPSSSLSRPMGCQRSGTFQMTSRRSFAITFGVDIPGTARSRNPLQ